MTIEGTIQRRVERCLSRGVVARLRGGGLTFTAKHESKQHC
jgi:hypothetical protein